MDTWVQKPALPPMAPRTSLPFFQLYGYFKGLPASGPLHMLFSHVQMLFPFLFLLVKPSSLGPQFMSFSESLSDS